MTQLKMASRFKSWLWRWEIHRFFPCPSHESVHKKRRYIPTYS